MREIYSTIEKLIRRITRKEKIKPGTPITATAIVSKEFVKDPDIIVRGKVEAINKAKEILVAKVNWPFFKHLWFNNMNR